MVREATITQEQVNAASDALRAAGTRPTVRAVRERLGSGSNATVLRLLETWKAGQVHQPEAPIALPPALQRALMEFIGQTVAEGKLALETDLVDMQQANTDLVAESERQASTIEAQRAEAERVQSERDALAGRLEQMVKDLAAVRAELDQERAVRVRAEREAAVAAARLEGEGAARQRIEEELRDAKAREEELQQRHANEILEHIRTRKELKNATEMWQSGMRAAMRPIRQRLNEGAFWGKASGSELEAPKGK